MIRTLKRWLGIPVYTQIVCPRCNAPTNLAYTSEDGAKVTMYMFQCAVCNWPNTVVLSAGKDRINATAGE